MSWRRKAHYASIVVTVLLLAVILARADVVKLARAFHGIVGSWVVGVFFLNVLNTWVEAFRWRLILSSVKRETRTLNAFGALLVGVAGNTILPLRLGDGARAYFLARREGISAASSLGTVTLDRIMDVTFFVIMVALAGFFFKFSAVVRRTEILAAAAVVIAIAFLAFLVRLGPRFRVKFPGRTRGRVVEWIHRFALGLTSLKKAGVLVPVSVLSAFSWGLRLLMIAAMFRAFRFELPDVAAVVVLIFVNLGIAAVSTPANLGSFELSMLAGFSVFGADTERALSCAIVFHAVEVVPMVLMALGAMSLSGIGSRDLLSRKAPALPAAADDTKRVAGL
jgi:glycosyltransferase 2 family protein